MHRSRTIAAALLIPLLGAAARTALAHEAVDPVCGMTVSTDDAKWTAEYGGKTYYFCIDADRAAFLLAPEKYVAVLTVTRLTGDERLAIAVTPAALEAGALARIAIGPELGLDEAEAVLYHVDRTAPSTPLHEGIFHRLDDGTLAMQRTLAAAGEWRVVIDARRQGERLRAIFVVPVGPRPATPPAATAGEALAMADQHDSMRRLGARWAALGRALDAEEGREAALATLDAIDADARLLPRFTLHHHADAGDEFADLAGGFGGQLARLRTQLERGPAPDPAEVQRLYRDIDRDSCTRCHLKFRFALVDDLRSFPAVRPSALGEEDEE